MKVEKKVYYFENKHNFHPPPEKTLGVRVEMNIPKNSKAIIMLALDLEGVYSIPRALKMIRQYLET